MRERIKQIVFEEFSVEHNYDGKLEYKPFSPTSGISVVKAFA